MIPIITYVVFIKNLIKKWLREHGQVTPQKTSPIVPGGDKEAYDRTLKLTGSAYAAWLASITSQTPVWTETPEELEES